MIVSGNGYIAIGRQTAKGTAVAPDLIMPYLNDSFATGQQGDNLKDSGDNEYLLDNIKMKHTESFGFSVYARPKISSYLSAYMLGNTTISGTADPYTHTITRSTADRAWLTIERSLNTTTIQRLTDCKIEKITYSGEAGKPIKIDISGNALDSELLTTQYMASNLILHNLLGSTEEVESSMVGVDLVEVGGPDYSFCFWGKGIKCIDNEYAYVPMDGVLDHDAFTITWFTKYYDYALVSGDPDDGAYHDVIFHADAGAGYPQIYFLHRGPENYTQVRVIISATQNFGMNISAGLDVALNDIVFYALIYDSSQANPNIVKVYYKNITSGQTGTFTQTVNIGSPAKFTSTATHKLSLGQQHQTGRGGDVIIDNLKIWGEARSDFTSDLVEEYNYNTDREQPFMFYDGNGRFKYNTTIDDLFKSFDVSININSGGGLLNDQYELIDLPDFSMGVDASAELYTNNLTRFKEVNYNTSTTPQEDFSTGALEVDCQYAVTTTRQFKMTIPSLIWKSISGITLNPAQSTMTENIAGIAKKQATTELLTIVTQNSISTTLIT